MGMSYSQLVLKLKMEHAAQLLKQQGISIAAISAAVGYADVSSFYRAFTNYYHMTPQEFRNPSPAAGETDISLQNTV